MKQRTLRKNEPLEQLVHGMFFVWDFIVNLKKTERMTNRSKIILGATAIGAIGVILLLTRKQKVKKEKMLDDIADEGYETAGDILYPLKTRKFKGLSVMG